MMDWFFDWLWKSNDLRIEKAVDDFAMGKITEYECLCIIWGVKEL